MTRTLRGSLLIALMLVVTWATSSEACHRRRRACAPSRPVTRGIPTRAHGLLRCRGRLRHSWRGLLRGGYPGGTAGYPGGYGYGQPGSGYDFGRPGYNPGGLGGPASGLGVRPGLGVGGFGPGR